MNSFSKRSIIVISLVIVICIIASIVLFLTPKKDVVDIKYTEFLSFVKGEKVAEINISDSAKIHGKLKNGVSFSTDNPRTQTFKRDMLLQGINVVEKNSEMGVANSIGAILIVVAFVGLVIFLNKGKSKQAQKEINHLSNIDNNFNNDFVIKFDDVAGNQEAKDSVKELVEFICNPMKFEKLGARIPRGVLLYGPPGTGKTLLAKALASEAGVPFYAVNGSDFVQVYSGLGASRIRELFKKAREAEKCVIFIDEIDAVGKKRRGNDMGNDENDRTLNALLTQMSGFNGNEGIIVVAATNRVDILDDALLRPGRFDRQIEVGLPDVNARHKILKVHTQNKPLSKDVDLKKVALETVYFSGAKLESLMNESAMVAAKFGESQIRMKHIDVAYNNVVVGEEKQDKSAISLEDKTITAYHESGHALITKLICPQNRVSKVSIIPSTKGVGGFSMNIPVERMYKTKQDIKNEIMIALGGRAAEELMFSKDNITTGAINDLQRTTDMVVAMLYEYGMDSDVGMLNYSRLIENNSISNSMATKCNEVINLLYNDTKKILLENKQILERIAENLMNNEILKEDELDNIIDSFKKETKDCQVV